jgi:hypothetical protein
MTRRTQKTRTLESFVAGLALDRWGHDMTNRLAIIFGAIALFAWAHFFILVRHRGHG